MLQFFHYNALNYDEFLWLQCQTLNPAMFQTKRSSSDHNEQVACAASSGLGRLSGAGERESCLEG